MYSRLRKRPTKNKKGEFKMTERIWNYLIENEIATEEELQLVTDVAGYSVRTLEAVIYARTGYNDLEQLEEEM